MNKELSRPRASKAFVKLTSNIRNISPQVVESSKKADGLVAVCDNAHKSMLCAMLHTTVLIPKTLHGRAGQLSAQLPPPNESQQYSAVTSICAATPEMLMLARRPVGNGRPNRRTQPATPAAICITNALKTALPSSAASSGATNTNEPGLLHCREEAVRWS